MHVSIYYYFVSEGSYVYKTLTGKRRIWNGRPLGVKPNAEILCIRQVVPDILWQRAIGAFWCRPLTDSRCVWVAKHALHHTVMPNPLSGREIGNQKVCALLLTSLLQSIETPQTMTVRREVNSAMDRRNLASGFIY